MTEDDKSPRDAMTSSSRPSLVTPGPKLAAASYSGPLPPPAMLAEFERAVPGAAERILASVEKESDHRRAMDKREVTVGEQLARSHIDQTKLGLVFGFVIVIAALVAAVVLGLHGHDALAGVIAGLDLVGLASVFVIGKRMGDRTRDTPRLEAGDDK